MRRDINWTTRRPDGTAYDVRVTYFGGKFKMQFRENGGRATDHPWEYDRKPSRADLEALVDAVRRRGQRGLAAPKELVAAEKLLQECPEPETA